MLKLKVNFKFNFNTRFRITFRQLQLNLKFSRKEKFAPLLSGSFVTGTGVKSFGRILWFTEKQYMFQYLKVAKLQYNVFFAIFTFKYADRHKGRNYLQSIVKLGSYSLFFAQISKLNYQGLNSETKGAELLL